MVSVEEVLLSVEEVELSVEDSLEVPFWLPQPENTLAAIIATKSREDTFLKLDFILVSLLKYLYFTAEHRKISDGCMWLKNS